MTGGLALWHSAGPGWAMLVVLLAAGGIAGALCGDRTARHIGAVVLFGACLDLLVAVMPQPAPASLIAADHSGIDLLYLGMLTALCLRTPQFYPLVLAAAQLLVVITQALLSARLVTGVQIGQQMLAAPTALVLAGLYYAALRGHISVKTAPPAMI